MAYTIIPPASGGGGLVISTDNPQPIGTAAPGTTGEVSDAGHVHALGFAASDATPQAIGTAAAGDSANYSRANHVHALALAAGRLAFGNAGGTAHTSSADLTYDDTNKRLVIGGANAVLRVNRASGGTSGGIDFMENGSSFATIGLNAAELLDFTAGQHAFYIGATQMLVIGNAVSPQRRFVEMKGADVASAGSLTLGNGNLFNVTGSTAIDYISISGWTNGARVRLILKGAISINHNTGSVPALHAAIKCGSSITGADGDIIDLVYDGTVWRGGRIAVTGA